MLFAKLEKYADLGLLLLRLGVGFMFVFVHGGPKLFGGPETWANVGAAMNYLGLGFAPAFWGFMAAISEFLGGLLFMLGLFFRLACMLLFITMFVASNSHLSRGDGLARASHAIEDGFMFFGLIFIGPGKYSLDHYFKNRFAKQNSHK